MSALNSVMRVMDLARLILLGGLTAILGCAVTPAEVIPPACGEPPHSRFHPVPTRPVFESAMISPGLIDAPLGHLIEPPGPELLSPPPADGEPDLLPEVSSKPISYERPSSRRKG